jgi:hypothetical protein
MLFQVISILLMALGALSLADWFLSRVFSPKTAVRCLTVLPLRGRCEQIEAVLRYNYGSMRWGGWFRGGMLALVDFGADEETLRIARAFCEGKTGVALCGSEGLQGLAADDTVYKCLRIVLY